MSLPTDGPASDDAAAVFVDESGRRRTRTKLVARALVGAAGVYVLLVIAGLTGSVSLPGVRLGQLGSVSPKREVAGRLGSRSKVSPLPSALNGRNSPGSKSRNQAPGTTTGSRTGGSGVPNGSVPTTTKPSNPHKPTTTTNPKSTTTSSVPVTTTTKRHGPPTTTSTSHGPPSTKPGQGKGRT